MRKLKRNNSGGSREGAGRRSIYGVKTVPIRVPEDMMHWIQDNMDAIRALKDGKAPRESEEWE